MSKLSAVIMAAVALSMSVICGCGGGSAGTVYVTVERPAPNPIPVTIKTIAVVDFKGNDAESKSAGDVVAGKLSERLLDMKRFTLADRVNMKKVLAEQDLADAGLTDPDTAAKACKLLNTDAILVGTVRVTRSADKTYSSTPYVYGFGGGSQERVRHAASVSVTFKLLDRRNGREIAAKESTHNYDSGAGFFGHGKSRASDATIPEMIEACVADFMSDIDKSCQVYAIRLVAPATAAGKSGVRLALAGDYAAAADQLELATEADPGDASAIYDLGVVKLMQGDRKAAKELVVKAVAMQDNKVFTEGAAIINRIGDAPVQPASAGEVPVERRGEKKGKR